MVAKRSVIALPLAAVAERPIAASTLVTVAERPIATLPLTMAVERSIMALRLSRRPPCACGELVLAASFYESRSPEFEFPQCGFTLQQYKDKQIEFTDQRE
ncbi:hypothetical protein ZIOFF_047603 [Zingiber officinale]|uniref:Uncharacterized protein n=1 Tax=Zingiber officinale TaxID=94328 RepID=A0A8J5FPS7_ZINOF|nr:hypothetical protein ZIOFF_047603 [Zingiber officinale]